MLSVGKWFSFTRGAAHGRAFLFTRHRAEYRHIPGSALVSSAGFGVSPKRTFKGEFPTPSMRDQGRAKRRQSSRRRDVFASTRDKCATQNMPPNQA
jgi:hypothetical protein